MSDLSASNVKPILWRESREGGYTFVTSPSLPGWSYMQSPGEDDDGAVKSALFFLEYCEKHGGL